MKYSYMPINLTSLELLLIYFEFSLQVSELVTTSRWAYDRFLYHLFCKCNCSVPYRINYWFKQSFKVNIHDYNDTEEKPPCSEMVSMFVNLSKKNKKNCKTHFRINFQITGYKSLLNVFFSYHHQSGSLVLVD